MRILTAETGEIDNIAAAVSDIKAQLGDTDFPPEHTFGILTCHYEFVLSGAAEAVCASLAFPVCGTTTSLMGTNKLEGSLQFQLLVVTGDEITAVKTDITPPLSEDSNLSEVLSEIFKPEEEKAALVCVLAPDFILTSGDSLCRAYNETGYGVPLFGTYAVDDSPIFNEQCFVFGNGVSYDKSIVFLRVYGEIEPIIRVCSIPPAKILPRTGKVTASAVTTVGSIDNQPASVFLQNFGLADRLEKSGAISAVSLIASNPGSDDFYSRTLLGIEPDGSALTGGELPTGSVIRIGLFDREGMLEAVKETLIALLEERKVNALLICACATRSVALGFQGHDEVKLTREIVGDIPFTLTYSGGEIAPLKNGNAFFHNQSFCICAF
jgi:hypothetical protein